MAEDNEFNAQLLERLLARRGHRVRLANNGREALALAERGLPAFDLLLLDVHMPELDGFQVIQAIRERERSAGGHLPVIALTARSRQEDRERCLAAGMDDFLAKPIRAADLLAAIDRVVSPGVPRPPAGRPGRPSLLDPVVLLAACGGDAEALAGCVRASRLALPDRLAEVGDALRERDAPRLREAAHKLCGMVAAFSTVVGAVASDLEDQAARGQLEEAGPWWNSSKRWRGSSSSRWTACRSRRCETRQGLPATATGQPAPNPQFGCRIINHGQPAPHRRRLSLRLLSRSLMSEHSTPPGGKCSARFAWP